MCSAAPIVGREGSFMPKLTVSQNLTAGPCRVVLPPSPETTTATTATTTAAPASPAASLLGHRPAWGDKLHSRHRLLQLYRFAPIWVVIEWKLSDSCLHLLNSIILLIMSTLHHILPICLSIFFKRGDNQTPTDRMTAWTA